MAGSVVEAIFEAAESNPAAPAIIAPGQIIRYEQLHKLIAVSARTLQHQGVQAGDAIGLTMMTTPLHVITLLGLATLGACSVPLHPQIPLPVRDRLARKFQLAGLATDSQDHMLAGVRTIPVEKLTVTAALAAPIVPQCAPDLAMRIQLTSGTVGEPKGVRLTHRQVLNSVLAATQDYAEDARLLTADPHVSIGFYCLLITLARGGCLVFPQRYDLPGQVDAVVLHGVTHLILSPVAARKLLALLPPKGVAFPSLRQLRLVGGAPSAQLAQELVHRVSPHLYAPYTLTELAKITNLTAAELLADPRSAGRPSPGVELRVVDATGNPMAPGQRGEILVRRLGMPTEYVNDPERSRESFRKGWFHTGDIGYLSDDGRLYVDGRLDEVIQLGQNRIAPTLVEDFLMQHPDVKDAAVLQEGATGAESLIAVVVLADRQSDVDLKAYCKPLGARAPSRFVGAVAIPRNSAGKVMRELLRHELAATRA